MKEYRIRAYFKGIYSDRSYKGKVFNTYQEAEKTLPEAMKYYNSVPYSDKLIKVQIESRKVESWKEENRSEEMEKALRKSLKELAAEYIEEGTEAILEVEWWWSSEKSWRDYFSSIEDNPEDYGKTLKMEYEYSFKGDAEEFLNYCTEYECVGAIRGKDCEEFSIDEIQPGKNSRGGVVIYAKYIEEMY